jgi:hypothetical protein
MVRPASQGPATTIDEHLRALPADAPPPELAACFA